MAKRTPTSGPVSRRRSYRSLGRSQRVRNLHSRSRRRWMHWRESCRAWRRSDGVHVHDKRARSGDDSRWGLIVWIFVDSTELKLCSMHLRFTEFFGKNLKEEKILSPINIFLWFLLLTSSTCSRPAHKKTEVCFFTAGPGVKTTTVLFTQRCVDRLLKSILSWN